MSAQERISPNLVTYTTAVQLRIKEIITRDLLNGIEREQTYKKLKQLIERFSAQITDDYVRRQFETSLARGAIKIYEQTKARIEEMSSVFSLPLIALLSVARTPNKTSQKSFKSSVAESREDVTREYLFEDRIEIPNVRTKIKAEIRRLMFELADEDIKDRNGASLRNVAEIHVRHDYQQASIRQMIADGVKLVWASTHVDCSPRCFRWQGKLYSLDGTSGTTSTGVSYIPLEIAVNVPYTTKAGKTYMNGLLGFNCRHRLIPYRDEQEPPKGYTKAQTVKAYRLDLEQRELEREIRRVKERAHLLRGIENAESRQLFAQARKMTERYRQFCTENNRVAMIYRTQVTIEEQEINRKNAR